jgi:hypothetical protein
MQTPPMLVTAVLVSDPASVRVARFLAWLESSRTSPVLVVEWLKGTETAALAKIGQELGRIATVSANRQLQTAAEAARMRDINAELHHRFTVAESSLLRTGAMPLDLAFANDPVTDPAQHVSIGETERGIAQVLPIASVGVCAIGIHFAAHEAGSGALVAELASLEDGRVLERWLIQASAIAPGWTVLGLSRTLSGLSRTLELRLSKQGSDERLPAISLGAGQPIPAFQVRDIATGQAALRNSLALQVWRGLPGTHMPGWFNVHKPVRSKTAPGGFIDIPLAPVALAQVEHVNPEAVRFDFPAVIGPPGERAVMCHAPTTGMTIGRLGGTVPEGAIRFSASAFIDNQQSRDVDFALIVGEDLSRIRAIAEGEMQPEPEEGFSGWVQVTHGQVKRLSAFRQIAAPGTGIYVATRMTKAGDNSFARARFKDFSVMVQA